VGVKEKIPIHELKIIQAKKQYIVKPDEWKPLGWHCLNVDASYIHNTGEASWGTVIRDEKGQVASTAWALIQNYANAESAKAIACQEDIKYALTVTNSKLLVEYDYASLVARLVMTKMIAPKALPLMYNDSAPCLKPSNSEISEEMTTQWIMS
jgi:hypothetical protein